MAIASRYRGVCTAVMIFFACTSISAVGQPRTAPSSSTFPIKEDLVNLADSTIEYFTQGQGQPIVLLPFGGLTVGYMDGLSQDDASSAEICAVRERTPLDAKPAPRLSGRRAMQQAGADQLRPD
jgi:hypothetical protein